MVKMSCSIYNYFYQDLYSVLNNIRITWINQQYLLFITQFGIIFIKNNKFMNFILLKLIIYQIKRTAHYGYKSNKFMIFQRYQNFLCKYKGENTRLSQSVNKNKK